MLREPYTITKTGRLVIGYEAAEETAKVLDRIAEAMQPCPARVVIEALAVNLGDCSGDLRISVGRKP